MNFKNDALRKDFNSFNKTQIKIEKGNIGLFSIEIQHNDLPTESYIYKTEIERDIDYNNLKSLIDLAN